MIMTSLIVCCLIVLAIVMIPKAIRHRKQIKQNESKNPAPNEEQEVEITIISEENMKSNKKQSFDYRKTFLTAPKLEDRKPVFVSRETRDSLDKIARRLGDHKMSVSGFIENMAKHHLEEYEEEINRLYKE
jgi:biopolymer transport protein ExbD